MAKAYRRIKTCGRVPYPDRSGRFLTDEIVIGDEWEPYVAIGYVERIEGDVDPSMFAEQPQPKIVSEPRHSHVGSTVTDMVEKAVEMDRVPVPVKKNPTVMELARAATRANGEAPATVRDAARKALAARKGTRASDIAGGVDELRPPNDGTGAEGLDS